MYRLLLLSCFFALYIPALNAEIYRYTDEHGHTVYSDKAPKNVEPFSLPDLNTTPAVEIDEPQRKTSKAIDLDNYTIHISAPSDGAIIPNGLIPTTVTVSTDQALRKGQQIRISLDGRELNTSTSTSHTIPRLARGQHQISANIIDRNGKSLAESRIQIMVYRPGN